MATDLQADIFRTACEDDWVAKTYSEYLLSCAENKLDLMDSVQDASSDEQLSDIVDQWSDFLSDSFTNVKNAAMIDYYSGNYPFVNISWTSPEFKVAYLEWINTDEGIAWWNQFSNEITVPDLTGYEGSNDREKFLSYMQTHNDDDIIIIQPDYTGRVSALVNEFLSGHGYNDDTSYTLNDGSVNLKETLKGVITLMTCSVSNPELSLSCTGFDDGVLPNLNLTLEEFWNETKANLGSTIAWAEGFAECAITNASDAINTFKEKVSTYFSDASSYINQSINTVKNVLISAKGNVSQFLTQAGDLLGWSDIGDTLQTVNETDMSQYTGASPYGDISLNTAKGIAVATAKTVAAAAVGIWTAVKNLAVKAWKKVRPYLKAITTDPEDIGTVDKDATSYTFENFCYNKEFTNWMSGQQIMLRFPNGTALQNAYSIMNKNKSKWISYQTFGAEVLFRIDYVSIELSNLYIGYSYQYKPRVIDAEKLLNSQLIEYYSGQEITPQIYTENGYFNRDKCVQRLKELSTDDIRLNDDESEEKKYFSLLCTNLFNAAVHLNGMKELAYSTTQSANASHFPNEIYVNMTEEVDGPAGYCPIDTFSWNICRPYNGADNIPFGNAKTEPSVNPTIAMNTLFSIDQTDTNHWIYKWNNPNALTVNNKQVLQGVCGYNSDIDDSFTHAGGVGPRDSIHTNASGWDVSRIIVPLLYAFIIQKIDKSLNPDEYIYIPYSSDNYTFMDAHYKVITDAEHQNVAQIFITAVVIVAVIAITVLVGMKVAKLFKAKKFARLNRKKGLIDNAMWNNSTLPNGSSPTSLKNAKKYLRYNNKLDKMTNSISGMSCGQTLAESISKVSSNMSNSSNESLIKNSDYPELLTRLICGEPNT